MHECVCARVWVNVRPLARRLCAAAPTRAVHPLRPTRAFCPLPCVSLNACGYGADGTVVAEYATGVSLGAAGVVPCGDMTVEAALTKLGCLLGRGLEPDEVRKKMATVSRGEHAHVVETKRFSIHNKCVRVSGW